MTSQSNLRSLGSLCLHSAAVLQLSWIPVLGVLDGESWASASLAVRAHHLALGFMLAAPLAYGARLWLANHGEEDRELIRTWAARCLAPLCSYAVLIELTVKILPHVTTGAIIGLMAASVPLALYGMALRREAASD